MNFRDALSENDFWPAWMLTPVCVCPDCGAENTNGGICGPCEDERDAEYLAANSMTNHQGVATGDDPRR